MYLVPPKEQRKAPKRYGEAFMLIVATCKCKYCWASFSAFLLSMGGQLLYNYGHRLLNGSTLV